MEDLDQRRGRIEDRLAEVLEDIEPPELAAQVSHVTLAGGKRVRPAITLLVCEALGGDLSDAIDFAIGIELVHTASLVVDDVIDESDIRRGTTTAWAEYGHGPALITSDGLLGEALALSSTDERAMEAVAEAMVELGEGEATELVDMPTTEDEYIQLAQRKTGALFRCAAELGAIAADADAYTIEQFGEYAQRVGIAFQIRDDVLDATADAEELGKPTNQDADMERPSFVEVTGLDADAATQRAQEYSDGALEALSTVDIPNQESVAYLEEFAEFVVQRER